MAALRVRKQLVAYLEPLIGQSATKKREDYKWMLATLANTLFALGETAKATQYEQAFAAAKAASWELETFEETKKDMAAQAEKYQALRKKMGL
jgi:hypothetical protein